MKIYKHMISLFNRSIMPLQEGAGDLYNWGGSQAWGALAGKYGHKGVNCVDYAITMPTAFTN